ncbi:MAG: ATP-binding cassette domain-containing protein [Pseudomonadales bacterium]
MPLLRLDQASIHYGTHALLDEVDLTIRQGDKIGLLGRNGAGKTTLLKVIGGLNKPDSGERWLRPGTEVAWLDQSLPDADEQSVYDVVAGGLHEVGELLKRFHHATLDNETPDLIELERIQAALEAKDGWSLQQRVETIIQQLQLPADSLMKELSGGWRRRVALARALVREPDILLLDEPTNHLDIPAIEWLEEQLKSFRGALVVITHDRAFLQQTANQIIELDRGRLRQWEGSYQGFLKLREQQLAAEERANELFDKKLAEEEVWIRQGIKARRTRNEGRVRALKAMREERQERREQVGKANISIENAGRSGKIVAELKDIRYRYDDSPVIDHFSCNIMRGDRIGIVGVNGAGKSTLLKIILGQLTPQQGSVKTGTSLKVAYFDQLRQQLEPEKNLIDNICGGREFIEINGKRRHAISYLGDFLFSPERTRTPVKALSGGEQNRAILAKLFSQPANLLVLDEPTNDLDIETLELLEEILLEFNGTVLLVSHDRDFMDHVVTGLFVLEGNGKVTDHIGGYSDWVARGGKLRGLSVETRTEKPTPEAPVPENAEKTAEKQAKRKKLSYKDQLELDKLPALIEKLEQQQSELEARISDSEFYKLPYEETQPVLDTLAETEQQLAQAYQRWDELESQQ